jgi:hypothetical protein
MEVEPAGSSVYGAPDGNYLRERTEEHEGNQSDKHDTLGITTLA